ncbi:MAG: hypothetical protein ABH829_04045 [archaeon]
MRAQAALEAMMVLAASAMIIAAFGGIYIRFSEKEEHFGSKAKMNLELTKIANAAGGVHFLGDGNVVSLRLEVSNFTLESNGTELTMKRGGAEVSKRVFGNVSAEDKAYSGVVRIENANGSVTVRAE